MDIGEFVRHPEYGVAAITAYYNRLARIEAGHQTAMVVRYETLRGSGDYDPAAWSRAFAYLLGRVVDAEALEWALEVNSFETMRAKERAAKGGGDENRLRVRSRGGRDALAALDRDAAQYVEAYLAKHLDARWNCYAPGPGSGTDDGAAQR